MICFEKHTTLRANLTASNCPKVLQSTEEFLMKRLIRFLLAITALCVMTVEVAGAEQANPQNDRTVGQPVFGSDHLVENVVANTRLSKADAKRALDGFVRVAAGALKKGDRISLVGFGALAPSYGMVPSDTADTAEATVCDTFVDIDFVPGPDFRNAAIDARAMASIDIAWVEDGNDGTVAVFGATQGEGTFRQGEDIILRKKPGATSRGSKKGYDYYQSKSSAAQIVGQTTILAVLITGRDGRIEPVEAAPADETVGLLLRGIEKTDIKRGMVARTVATPHDPSVCSPASSDGGVVPGLLFGTVLREKDLIPRFQREAQLSEEDAILVFSTILGTIVDVVNSGGRISLDGFGDFFEATLIQAAKDSSSIDNAPEEKERGRSNSPPSGVASVRIEVSGADPQDIALLSQAAEVVLRTGRNPQTGKEIKIAAKNVVRFKAGADLSSKVN
jgi:nucleoid DNA-binding protein